MSHSVSEATAGSIAGSTASAAVEPDPLASDIRQLAEELASRYRGLGPRAGAHVFLTAAQLALQPKPAPRGTALQALVDETPVRGFDEALAASMAASLDAIFTGCEWLTAAEVGRAYQPDVVNPNSAPSRWRAASKVYAVPRRGQLLFPRYEFTEWFEPQPAMAAVLAALAGLTPLAIASWFESPSSMLNARRPRDLLASDPELVLEAAHDHVRGPGHG